MGHDERRYTVVYSVYDISCGQSEIISDIYGRNRNQAMNRAKKHRRELSRDKGCKITLESLSRYHNHSQ